MNRLNLDKILGANVDDQIKKVEYEITPEPINFEGPEGIEVKLQKQINENTTLLGQHLGYKIDLYEITLFDYYSKLETIKKNSKPNGSKSNKIK